MLDRNLVEEKLEAVTARLNTRQADYSHDLQFVAEKNRRRKQLLVECEALKSEKNQATKQIAELAKSKATAEIAVIKEKIAAMSAQIAVHEQELQIVEAALDERIKFLPNLPAEDVPVGIDESENVETYRSKHQLKKGGPEHWEIAEKLGLINATYGANLSGSRFVVYTGLGAKLVRAIADVLLTRHVRHGYEEFFLPLVVNEAAMYGTGQLPKFAEDAYKAGKDARLLVNPHHLLFVVLLEEAEFVAVAQQDPPRQQFGVVGMQDEDDALLNLVPLAGQDIKKEALLSLGEFAPLVVG